MADTVGSGSGSGLVTIIPFIVVKLMLERLVLFYSSGGSSGSCSGTSFLNLQKSMTKTMKLITRHTHTKNVYT